METRGLPRTLFGIPLTDGRGRTPPPSILREVGALIPAGNLADIPVGTVAVLSGENVILCRDRRGVYAMSAVCTRAGGLLTLAGCAKSGGVFRCGCHNSEFSANGEVTRGAAPGPLQHYRIEVAGDGAITIHRGQPVSADARAAND